MKKLLFLILVVGLQISLTSAQQISKANLNLNKPVKTNALTQTKTTTDPQTPASVYSLTSVRVNIRTGSDNKEFPSKVFVTLKTKSAAIGDWSSFIQMNLDNEMRVNSNTEFGLEREVQLRGIAALDAFQKDGLKLIIKYLPNFFADAWKIENISLTIEFKDQYGNLHPTLGSKTIVFGNAFGFLNNDYQVMECVTDGSFAPLTAVIKKNY
jgi:hypothetical protein